MAFQTITPENVLEQFLTWSPADQQWLRKQLDRLLDSDYFPQNGTSNGNEPKTAAVWQDDDDEPLPERATLDEAITLYLADKCSLGRAAELASVTRWDIMDVLYERGIPTNGGHDFTPEEYERMLDILEERYGYSE